MKYQTRDGDVLDAIALKYYGTTEGTVEKILEENRELAFQPVSLPSGLIIDLPNIVLPIKENKKVRLWD